MSPDKADQDLRDVLSHGLMDEADKKQVSTLLQSGRSNSEIAYWLRQSLPSPIETLNLETGSITCRLPYHGTGHGSCKSWAAEEKRFGCAVFPLG